MFSDYMQKQILGYLFNGGALYQPKSYQVGVSFTDPSKSVTEPNTGGYARVTIQNNTTDITAPAPDTYNGGNFVANNVQVTFPAVTDNWTNGGYNLVLYWVLYDDQATPNLIAYGSLGEGRTVLKGDTPSFDPQTLTFTLR